MTKNDLIDIRKQLLAAARAITGALADGGRGRSGPGELDRGVPVLLSDPAWRETVARWLAEQVDRGALGRLGDGRVMVTPAQVLTGALGVPARRHSACGSAIAAVLNDLGWSRGDRVRVAGGTKVTPYYAPAAAAPSPVEVVGSSPATTALELAEQGRAVGAAPMGP